MNDAHWRQTPFDLRGKKIWVAGHTGMVGSAVIRRFGAEGLDIVTPPARIDLRHQAAVKDWMGAARPDVVILAAAKVGGIGANAAYPAEFLYDNLMIEANVIHGAYEAGVQRLVFLGSSCIYPKDAAQPIAPEALLSGALEPTNAPYALAKIAGIELCRTYRAQYGCDFISLMPCNLYGPGDTYDADNSHVIPALIMKLREAQRAGAAEVCLWGTGAPLREFLHVDDLADGILHAARNYSGTQALNIGSGKEVSILTLAQMIAGFAGYKGRITWDHTRPDGVRRKLLDCSILQQSGWLPKVALEDGLASLFD